jgi:hypothetical protein
VPTDLLVDAAAGALLSREEDVGARPYEVAQIAELQHHEQRMALAELLAGVRQEGGRVERLQPAIREVVPEWSLAELVTAVQAMRGFDLIAAVGIVAETDFKTRASLWAIWALCPQKAPRTMSSAAVSPSRQGSARHILVEAAWSYRYPPRVSRDKQPKWRLHRDGCGRSHGTRKRGCADASGHLSAKASGRRSSPRLSHKKGHRARYLCIAGPFMSG